MKRTIKLSLVGSFLGFARFVGVPSADAAIHTVRSGDTLSKLFPANWQSVCRHNGLANCNLIYVGQRIDDGAGAPTTRVAGTSAARPSQVTPPPTSGRYVPYGEVLGGYYVYGGTGAGGGFDCSGLTQYLAARMGFAIPRNSYGQMNGLRAISRAELWPGDIVVMNGGGHVGTYIGNNQVIHAQNPAQGIAIHNLDFALQYNPLVGYRAVGH